MPTKPVIFVVISVLVVALINSPSITFAVRNVVIQQLTPIPTPPPPPLFGQVAPQVQAPLTTTPLPTPPQQFGQIAPETQTPQPPDEQLPFDEQPPPEDEGPVTPFKKWYDEQRFDEEPPDEGDKNGSSDEENGDTEESEGNGGGDEGNGGESGDGENGDE